MDRARDGKSGRSPTFFYLPTFLPPGHILPVCLLEGYWMDTGGILEEYWTNTGNILEEYWVNTVIRWLLVTMWLWMARMALLSDLMTPR